MKQISKQEYEKNKKSPSNIVFYATEKDLCEIVSLHLVKNIKENIDVLEKLSYFKNVDIIETKNVNEIFYIIKNK